MSTITAVLEPDAEGFLHLPAPPELRSSKVKVVVTLQAVNTGKHHPAAKLQELLATGRGADGATATARIAEVYEDREVWRPRRFISTRTTS